MSRLSLLVAFGVAARLLCQEMPNCNATAAVALFAGFYFAGSLAAIVVPLAVIAISNIWLPSYASGPVMIAVYVTMLYPVLLGVGLRRHQGNRLRAAGWFAICLLTPSLVFYLATNFAVWQFQTLYAHTPAGLWECYLSALPFYKWSLQGDLLFGPLLFGAYVAARGVADSRRRQAAIATCEAAPSN